MKAATFTKEHPPQAVLFKHVNGRVSLTAFETYTFRRWWLPLPAPKASEPLP